MQCKLLITIVFDTLHSFIPLSLINLWVFGAIICKLDETGGEKRTETGLTFRNRCSALFNFGSLLIKTSLKPFPWLCPTAAWGWHQLLLNSSERREEGDHVMIRFPAPVRAAATDIPAPATITAFSSGGEPAPGNQCFPPFLAALSFAVVLGSGVEQLVLQKWLEQLSRTWARKSFASLEESYWCSKSSPFWWVAWSVSVNPGTNFSLRLLCRSRSCLLHSRRSCIPVLLASMI